MDHGFPRVSTLAYALEITPTPSPFEAREGILFVGGIYTDPPNWDSVVWFVREIFPRILDDLEVNFTVVGTVEAPPRREPGRRPHSKSPAGWTTWHQSTIKCGSSWHRPGSPLAFH